MPVSSPDVLRPEHEQRHNTGVTRSIKDRLAHPRLEKKVKAVLKGLLWAIDLVDDDDNFDFVAPDYLLMLYELTLNDKHPFIKNSADRLARDAMWRISTRLQTIFPATESGRWRFISVAPFVYRYRINVAKLEAYYRIGLSQLDDSPYKETFEDALASHDYDSLGGYLLDQFHLNRLLLRYPDTPLALPENKFPEYLQKAADQEFPYTVETADKYSKQNYHVTHLVYMLSDFGATPPAGGPVKDRTLAYLLNEYENVRYITGDNDLLAEFIHCLKIYGLGDSPLVKEAEGYLLALQREDGSWASEYVRAGDPYDQFHPTWTVITSLNYSNDKR